MFPTFAALDAATDFQTKAGFTLADKQVAGIEELATYPRNANFSEVGTGKTVMSTAVSLMTCKDTTLVLVPPIIIPQWCKWLRRFTDSVTDYRGTPTERRKLNITARFVVMSHAIFRMDYEKLYHALNSYDLEIIVDESHSLKNPSSILYKNVARLSLGHNLQLLTGTPTSKPTDAYVYIKQKTPKLYRTFGHFENMHVAERDFFGKVTKWQLLDQVAANLALQTVKFTKEDLFGLDLDPQFPDCSYDLDPAHTKLYERLMEEQLLLLGDGTKIDATTSTKLFHAAQQIVCNWAHFSGEDKRSAIYDIIDQTLEEVLPTDSKLIIWTFYKMTTRNVMEYLAAQGHKAVAAYGEANSNKSFELFMEDPTVRILVAQPQSAGVGLNAQGVCSEMLFVETPTTPLLARQAIGRVVRMGQKRKPRIKVAVANNTIQTRLLGMLMDNDDLVKRVENTRDSIRDWIRGT